MGFWAYKVKYIIRIIYNFIYYQGKINTFNKLLKNVKNTKGKNKPT
jgi:hypothetical protein